MAIIDLIKRKFSGGDYKIRQAGTGRFLGCMVRSVSDDGTDSS